MFRFFPPLRDPRAALFGLTFFSNQSPGIEDRLENFANILETTRKSLSIIRTEMKSFETTMHSLMVPSKQQYSNKPVEIPEQEEADCNPSQSYTPPPVNPQGNVLTQYPASYAFEQPVTTMAVEPAVEKKNESSDQLQSFLRDLQRLIDQYTGQK